MIKSPPVEGFSFAAKPSGYTAEENPFLDKRRWVKYNKLYKSYLGG